MVLLEYINSNKSSNIQWVIQEAMKIGNLKTLEEAMTARNSGCDLTDIVILGKVRELIPLIKGDCRQQIQSKRVMILKEVCKDGSYGNKFRALLFGDAAEDSERANVSIGDRFIFVKPSVVLCSMFEQPAHLSKIQLECGVPYYEKQRVILIVKKFQEGNTVGESKINVVLSEEIENSTSKEQNNVVKGVDSEHIKKNSSSSQQPLTESHNKKQIDVDDLKFTGNSSHILTNKMQKICEKNNYVYKKIKDIDDVEHKVNAYVVVAEILQVNHPEENRNGFVTFRGVDDTCKGKQHVLIRIMFDRSDTSYKKIQLYSIVRVHRMKVNFHYGNLSGIVFKGSDVLIFPFINKDNVTAITSAKTFTFVSSDQRRVEEIRQWLKMVYLPSHETCEVKLQTLDNIKPDETFQMYCRIEGITTCSKTGKLILHVGDGTTCSLRTYKLLPNRDVSNEEPANFVSELKLVDVIVEKPSETIRKLQKDDYITLGPIKLTQCLKVDQNDPNCYKMNLQNDERKENVKILNNGDPAIEIIKKRCVTLTSALQTSQKDGVREKRKLFNVNNNIEHTEPKRSKSDLSELCELLSEREQGDEPSTDIRPKSPFEDEMFDFTQTVSTDVYTEQVNRNNRKNPNSNTSKQIGNLKKESLRNKIETRLEVQGNTVPPVIESKETDNITQITELKRKRIDTMSRKSVEQCFEELDSVITKKYVLSKNKQSSPGTDTTKPKTSPLSNENVNINAEQLTIPSVVSLSSSSSSVVALDGVEIEDKPGKCISKHEVKADNFTKDNQMFIKLIRLPPGKEPRVVRKDNVVEVEMDNNYVDVTKQISHAFSLCNTQLQTNSDDNTSPICGNENSLESEKEIRGNILKQQISKKLENWTKKHETAMSVTDQLKLNEPKTKELRSDNRSVISTTIKSSVDSSGQLEPRSLHPALTELSLKNTNAVGVDFCDTNTRESVVQEKVCKRPTKTYSVSSSATTVKNKAVAENHGEDLLAYQLDESLNSVKSWLYQTDFSIANNTLSEDSVCAATSTTTPMNNPLLFMDKEDVVHPAKGTSKLRVFVMDIQPDFKKEPLDLISGYCYSGCHKLYLLSTLLWLPDVKRILCAKCYKDGEEKEVHLMFTVQMRVLDQEGSQEKLLLIREHAEQFFGCTVSEYISSQNTMRRVIKTLSRLKYDKWKPFIPALTVCVAIVGNQMFITDTNLKSV